MTLIEVMFAAALTAIVIAAGVTAMYSGLMLYGQTSTRSAQLAAMETTMDAIIGGMRREPEGVRYEDGALWAGGVAFKNAGGHVVADKDVWVEFAAISYERDGGTIRITITTDGGASLSRTWTLRTP